MVDGSAQLMSIFFGIDAMHGWGDRGTNILDGGAHFYNVYETADGEYVSIASYEPKFYVNLLRVLGLDDLDPAAQMDRTQWPALKERFAAIFGAKTRDEWVAFFAGTEVCFAPVLRMSEARAHPHNVTRQTFIDVDGAPQPAPAPRFDRTPSAVRRAPVAAGTDTDTALVDWGFTAEEVARLKASGALRRVDQARLRRSALVARGGERGEASCDEDGAGRGRVEERAGDRDRERGGDTDCAVHVREHPAQHLGRDRPLQERLQVDVDRRGADTPDHLEHDGQRDRTGNPGQGLADADDHAPADEAGGRRHREPAAGEHAKPATRPTATAA